jgi:hypothetical protein
MLYKIFETQRSLMEPFADFAHATAKLYSNPMSPISGTSFGQRVSAGYDLIYRLGKDYEKPEFGIKSIDIDGVEIAIHERIELDKPFCELRRFKRFSDDSKTLTKIYCAIPSKPCSKSTRCMSPTGAMPDWCQWVKASFTLTTMSITSKTLFAICKGNTVTATSSVFANPRCRF